MYIILCSSPHSASVLGISDNLEFLKKQVHKVFNCPDGDWLSNVDFKLHIEAETHTFKPGRALFLNNKSVDLVDIIYLTPDRLYTIGY